MAAYSVSKGAAYNLSEAVAGELMEEGIRVTTVCPGAINTNITMREDLTDYKPEQMQQVRKHYREHGMSPADVAAQVVDAVQTNKAAIYPLAMKMNLLRRLLPVMKLRQATVASLRSMGFVPEAAK
jgi:short-subunit dehydrogenase